MRIIVPLWLLFFSIAALAQQPVANFNLPSAACLNQNIYLDNTSTNATWYEWDFCQGDLSTSPVATAVKYLGGSVTLGTDVIFDGTNWYGFVINRNTNSILRLDFASDLYSTPAVTDLGNISGVIQNPSDIKIIFENGNWYAFVYGSATPAVVRVDFGNSLTNTTSTASPITATVVMSDSGSSNGGFDMIYDGSNWIIVYIQNTSLITARLNTVTSVPAASDIIAGTNDSFASGLGDIVLQKSNGKFYGYTVAYGNQSLQRLTFGTTMFVSPVIDDITSILPSTSNRPFGVDMALDNGNYYLLIATLEGSLYKIDLGPDLDQAPVAGVNLGTLSIITNTLKLRIVNQASQWFIFSTDFTNAQLFRVTFSNPSSCPTGSRTSNLSNPVIQYNTAGRQFVTLRSFNGSVDQISKSVTVSNQVSPDIDFSNTGVCVNNNTNFTAINSSGNINSYAWDFGDGNTSTVTIPSVNYTYTSAATFNTTLVVSASNGCQNTIEKSISIYNPPNADFSLPTPSVSCTNQDYVFTNTTTADAGSDPTWQWYVAGSPDASTQDLTTSFSTSGNQTIQLVASIPGCSSQSTQMFLIQQQGPLTDFTLSGICKGDTTNFTDQTIGPVANYTWDFGDGSTSTTMNPQHFFGAIGAYDVTLTASNAAGCNNFVTKTVNIYSRPQTNFSFPLPPFSCSGASPQLMDQTPAMFDSNITSWQWNFGDPSSSQNTSSTKNPIHVFATAGTYKVTLTTTTNNNCSSTIQKSVNILPSPIAAFTNNPACKDQVTTFSDASTGNPVSWSWQIAGASSILKEQAHIFSASGNYLVTLSVKGSNGCISFTSKNINVPAAQFPNFTVYKNCTAQQTVFKDSTATSSDPIQSYAWDFAGLGTATGSPATFSFANIGTYGISLRVTAQSGCSYSITKNIDIVAAPVAAFTASPMVGVPPLDVHFTNTSTLATSYLWTFNDAHVTTSTETSPSYTFNKFGNYVVDLLARNDMGCTTTISKIISAILPSNDIAITALSTIQNADGSLNTIVTLKNNGNTSVSNLAVILDLSGNATVREKINATIQTNQTLNHLFNFDITDVSQLTYLCAEAPLDGDINPANNSYCISLKAAFLYNPYPNPASDLLHVDFIANSEDHLSVDIIDALARKSFQGEFRVNAGLNQFTIPTNNLSPGIYIVTVQTSTEKKVSKIVIAR